MTNRIFVIADTHFGHKNIIGFEADTRPYASIEEHDADLVYRWNSVVRKNDTVWHLGDVLFDTAAFDTLAQLNGVKKLVMGNHDRYPSAKYLEHFSQIFGTVKMRDCVFTHVPVHPYQFYCFKANVHGHMHSNSLDDPRYICVSAEQVNLTPILLDTVMLRVPK